MFSVSKVTLNLTLRGFGSHGGIWNNLLPDKYVTKHIYNNNSSVRFLKTTTCPIKMPPSTALVLLATGAEEIEFVTVVDVLRRGNVKVTISGLDTPELVKCRCDTWIRPDTDLARASCHTYGVVVLPGGLGAATLFSESKAVGKLLKAQESSNGLIAAICAAPTVLKTHGICQGYNVTCYPGLAKEMSDGNLYKCHADKPIPVIVDKNLITSRGPATATHFAFTILGKIMGDQVAKEVGDAMLFDYCITKVMQKVDC